MIRATLGDIMLGNLPEAYYAADYCLYMVKNHEVVIYIGIAERQSVHGRLLQHLALPGRDEFFTQATGPSELGWYVRAHSPGSLQWSVDLLTLADCQELIQPKQRQLSIRWAEKQLIHKYSPLLNRTHNTTRNSGVKAGDAVIRETSARSGHGLPEHALTFIASSSLNRKTQETYRSALLRLQQFGEAKKHTSNSRALPPQQFYPEMLGDYAVWLQLQGLKSNTIRTYLASIQQYLRWLQEADLLPGGLRAETFRRALERIFGPNMERLPHERRQPDGAVEELLSYYATQLKSDWPVTPRGRRQKLATLRNQAIMLTLYSTAGRASEVASLTRAQFESSTMLSVTTPTELLPIPVGDKGRVVFITVGAREAIQTYLIARDATAPKLEHDALFVRHDRDGSKPISPKTVWLIAHEAAKAIFGCDVKGKPNKHIGPHDFRRLRAKHLHERGMSLENIQEVLGHSSPLTTKQLLSKQPRAQHIAQQLEIYGRDPQ